MTDQIDNRKGHWHGIGVRHEAESRTRASSSSPSIIPSAPSISILCLLDLSANTVFIAGAFRRALDGIRMREYWDIRRNPSLPPGIAFIVRCISPDVAGCEWNWLMPFQQRDLTSDVRQVFLDRLQL